MGEYYIVGDVHGCVEELRQLLENVTEDDCVIFCGDLVDRGPDSIGVVRYAYNLPNRVLVQGNHEKKHIRYWAALHDERRGPEIRAKMLARTPELMTLEEGLTDGEKEWIRESPFWHRLPWGDIVVHAGFPDSIQTLPEDPKDLSGLSSKQRKRMEQLLHVRMLAEDGRFVPLNQEEEKGRTYWAERYDGRFGFAWFGHHPHYLKDRVEYPHAHAMDRGCVFDGSLQAVILDQDGCRVGFKRIPAIQKYAEPMI